MVWWDELLGSAEHFQPEWVDYGHSSLFSMLDYLFNPLFIKLKFALWGSTSNLGHNDGAVFNAVLTVTL